MLKWLHAFNCIIFVLCAAGFAWRVYESFVSLRDGDVGSKVSMERTDYYPSFAVCRQPYQIIDDYQGTEMSLENLFEIKAASAMSSLGSYWNTEERNSTYHDVFQNYLSNNNRTVISVDINSWEKHDNALLASYTSSPHSGGNQDDWSAQYHPVLGVCFVFNFNDKVLEEVGDEGVSSLQVNLNFGEAYPNRMPSSDGGNGTSSQDYDDNDEAGGGSSGNHRAEHSRDEKSLMVVAFQPTSFVTQSTQSVTMLPQQNRYISLEQRIVDRSAVSAKVGCDPDEKYDEDRCLKKCLVEQVTAELNCLHPRLAKLRNLPDAPAVCNYSLLLGPTLRQRAALDAARRRSGLSPLPEATATLRDFRQDQALQMLDEAGLRIIKDRLAKYSVTSLAPDDGASGDKGLQERCGCRIPCLTSLVKLLPIDTLNAADPKISFVYFQFDRYVDMVSYHYLYVLSDFIADLGGLSGLFLGLSALGIGHILTGFAQDRLLQHRAKTKAGASEENRGYRPELEAETSSNPIE